MRLENGSEQVKGWVRKRRKRLLFFALLAMLLLFIYLVFVRGRMGSWL